MRLPAAIESLCCRTYCYHNKSLQARVATYRCCRWKFQRLGMRKRARRRKGTQKWSCQTAGVSKSCEKQRCITVCAVDLDFAWAGGGFKASALWQIRHSQDLLVDALPSVHLEKTWIRTLEKSRGVGLEENTHHGIQEGFLQTSARFQKNTGVCGRVL